MFSIVADIDRLGKLYPVMVADTWGFGIVRSVIGYFRGMFISI